MSKLTVVMYHYVRPIKKSRFPEIKGLELSAFQQQLDYLSRHYHFVSVPEIASSLREEKKLPENSVLLTFDDGYIDHYLHVFPELMKRGIKGAFYPPVNTVMKNQVLDVNKIHFVLCAVEKKQELVSFIDNAIESERREYPSLETCELYREQYMHPNEWDTKEVIYIKRMLQHALPTNVRSKIINQLFSAFVTKDEDVFAKELYVSFEQLKLMHKCGMHIGSHGTTHVWLNKVSKEEQQQEIETSVDFLNQIAPNQDYYTICYPFGGYNQETIEILEQNKFLMGFTTKVGISEISRESQLLEIQRLDTNHLPKKSDAAPSPWTEKVC